MSEELERVLAAARSVPTLDAHARVNGAEPNDEPDARGNAARLIAQLQGDEDAPPRGDTNPSETDGGGKTDGKQSMAVTLVDIAESCFWFASNETIGPFAVEHDGPNIARPLRRDRLSLRSELSARYHAEKSRVPSATALTDALLVLEGKAGEHDEPTALRVGTDGDAIILDLGRRDGRVVRIAPGSWSILLRSPILFRRTALIGELPEPARGGDLDELRPLLNVRPESWPLVVGWLVAALIPDIPHPIPTAVGEPGTGKTTTARLLAASIDTSPAQLRGSPRTLDDWSVAASGSWAVAIDNISQIPAWLSDALCRATTGDGLVKRALYSDADLAVLNFRRCIILNGIDLGALRGDLADRLLWLEVERFAPTVRRTDAEIAAQWADAHPRILGAICDLTAAVLAGLPDVTLDELPRMADFARVLQAIDTIRATSSLDAYLAAADRIADEVIASDPVAQAVATLVANIGDTWHGTSAELYERLTPERPAKTWPKSPRVLSGDLTRSTPALRTVGIDVERGRDTTGRRLKTIAITNTRDP